MSGNSITISAENADRIIANCDKLLAKGERRGRPSAQQTQLKLTHEIEDLKKQNADLRARMADHFYAMSVPLGGA